jgi:hypothetical protein
MKRHLIALALLLTVPAFGTIDIPRYSKSAPPASTPTAEDLPGASGTDWSQQDSPQYSVTDGVTNGTTTVTSATANFGTDVVGNCIYINGGTGSVSGTNIRQIVSRTNATTIVVDSSSGLTAGTGVTLKIGGAYATPGRWIESTVTIGPFGCDAYIKAGTYAIGTGAVNTAGNKFSMTGGSTDAAILEGYQTTRGDLGTRPILRTASAATPIIASGGNKWVINVEVDGNGVTANGISTSTNDKTINCKATSCTTTGFPASNTSIGFRNWAHACATGFSITGSEISSIATSCTTQGYTVNTASTIENCIDSGSPVGFTFGGNCSAINCVAFGGAAGVNNHGFTGVATLNLINCIAYGKGGKGFSAAFNQMTMTNCAAGGNTGVNEDMISTGRKIGFVTLTANPFTASGSNDFTLNATAGGGVLLRATGYPASYGNALTTQQLNIGAAQNSAAAAAATGGSFTYSN